MTQTSSNYSCNNRLRAVCFREFFPIGGAQKSKETLLRVKIRFSFRLQLDISETRVTKAKPLVGVGPLWRVWFCVRGI
jgi:hypothetical protein